MFRTFQSPLPFSTELALGIHQPNSESLLTCFAHSDRCFLHTLPLVAASLRLTVPGMNRKPFHELSKAQQNRVRQKQAKRFG
jgi:hypothetical protein